MRNVVLGDWLPIARRLHVGQSVRVDHGHSSRGCMSVSHLPDKYMAYCFACGQGGVYTKEYTTMSAHNTPKVAPTPPNDLQGLRGENVWRFLASKGMVGTAMLTRCRMSPTRPDSLFILHDRGISERRLYSNPKWMHYNFQGWLGTVRSTTVVYEDCLSWYKASEIVSSPDIGHVWVNGTSLSKSCLNAILVSSRVVCAFDGDVAGDLGHAKLTKRLGVHGIKCIRARPPQGLDIKHLDRGGIRGLLTTALDEGC